MLNFREVLGCPWYLANGVTLYGKSSQVAGGLGETWHGKNTCSSVLNLAQRNVWNHPNLV